MRVSDFDYVLPPGSIAQRPAPRGTSRLMTLGRADGSVGHRSFADLPELLRPGDVLVVNDTRVIPARLYGLDPRGRRTEFLLSRHAGSAPETWDCLAKPGRRAKPGVSFDFGDGLQGE
ncbi:MAG TPA: S-adenosylmethionine:tRNA ribosyltransferase-isomerase, partial [Thermoanaerobaculia bacterium]